MLPVATHGTHYAAAGSATAERLETGDLRPCGRVQLPSEWPEPEPIPLHLRPLELFDNLDYELYDPEEWVELGEEDGVSCWGHTILQL